MFITFTDENSKPLQIEIEDKVSLTLLINRCKWGVIL